MYCIFLVGNSIVDQCDQYFCKKKTISPLLLHIFFINLLNGGKIHMKTYFYAKLIASASQAGRPGFKPRLWQNIKGKGNPSNLLQTGNWGVRQSKSASPPESHNEGVVASPLPRYKGLKRGRR